MRKCHKRQSWTPKVEDKTKTQISTTLITPQLPKAPEAKIPLSWVLFEQTTDTLTFSHDLPVWTKQVEVRIYKNGKVAGFGIHDGSIEGTLCLSKDTFANQNITAHKPLILGKPLDYTPGEKYQIGIICVSDTGKTEEFKTEAFTLKKGAKQSDIAPPILQSSTVRTHTTRRVKIVLTSAPLSIVSPPTPSLEKPENKKETEIEHLKIAIQLFLELHDATELQSILEETATWNEESQTIMIHIPDEKLIEMWYTRVLLESEEYHTTTRWVSRLVGTNCIHSADMPQEIQGAIPNIYAHIMTKQARIKIDDELSHIGFRTSEANNTHILRQALQDNQMNYLFFSRRIQEISGHLPLNPHGPKTGYKFFKGPEVRGVPQSFSLVDSGRWGATLSLPEGNFTFRVISQEIPKKDLSILSQRIENALLNLAYSCIGKKKTGLAGIIEATSLHDDRTKLRKIYQCDLQEKKARLLVENSDGIFSIVEGIGQANLLAIIQELQKTHGNEKVGKLLRIDTYAFVGDTSICKPSPQQSADDYESFVDSPERREILRERILKTLFNGSSGVHDRSAFIHGSAVYQVLMLQVAKIKERTKKSILREHIDDSFTRDFIELLKNNHILISYRPFGADSVGDIINLALAKESAA